MAAARDRDGVAIPSLVKTEKPVEGIKESLTLISFTIEDKAMTRAQTIEIEQTVRRAATNGVAWPAPTDRVILRVSFHE